jgi:multiple sugar transport system substrate-binding protein
MKKLLLVMLVLVAATVALFAAGGSEAAPDGSVSVVYNNFSAGENNAEVLNAMLDLFAEAHPEIQVENDAMGYGDAYWTQLTTRIAGGNAPDAFEVNMENFVPYVTRGVMLPLEEYYETSGAGRGVYSEAVLRACTFEGTLYAVPQSFSTVVLVYNQNLFDQAGVSYPTEDWTWDDALDAGIAISELGEDTWGMFNPIQFWEFYKVVQQNGGSLMNEAGTKFTINSPENLEALEYMVARIDDYNAMPDIEELADRTESDLFVEGKLGMWLNGVWSFSELKTRAPADLRWDIAVEPGNTSKATHFFANVAAVSTTSEHPREAFTLLNFLASDRDVIDLRLEAAWELPTVSDPALVERYINETPPENKEAVFRSLEYVVRPPALKQFNELATLVTTQLQAARDGIVTPREALDNAQDEAVRTISLE